METDKRTSSAGDANVIAVSMTELLLLVLFFFLIVIMEYRDAEIDIPKVKSELRLTLSEIRSLEELLTGEIEKASDVAASDNDVEAIIQAVQRALEHIDQEVSDDAGDEFRGNVSFPEIWTELKKAQLAQQKQQQLVSELDALKTAFEQIKKEKTSLETQVAKLEEELEADKGLLEQEIADLKGELEAAKTLANVSDSKIRDLRNQVKNLIRKGGLDSPPCWTNDAGKPEYTYSVTVSNNGVVVTPTGSYQTRSTHEAHPLLKKVPFSKTLSLSQFSSYTQAAFDWSKANDCRFYVYVRDKTTNKQSWKRGLLTVESHFYKYELRN